jgi:hypothetical protein
LTVNQQTARTIALPDGQTLYLSGMGYNGEGEVPVAGNGGKISETERERLNLLAELAILANEGSLVQEDGGWKHRHRVSRGRASQTEDQMNQGGFLYG